MQIQNSVIVVTGASSGIGKAAAIALGKAGANVVLMARSADKLAALETEIPGSLAIPVDISKFDEFRAALNQAHSHFGRIDGLVNNAGYAYEAPLEKVNLEHFEDLYRLNVHAPIIGMQTVIPWMREQGSGSIVNISSGTTFMAVLGYGPYSSSKRALNGLSLTTRGEVADDGIAVSLVHPTVTATDFGYNKVVEGEPRTHPSAYAKGDPPEHVAAMIIQAIEEGGPEYFANEQLRQMARSNQ